MCAMKLAGRLCATPHRRQRGAAAVPLCPTVAGAEPFSVSAPHAGFWSASLRVCLLLLNGEVGWLQGDPDSISDGTMSDTDEEEEEGEALDSTKHMRVDLDLTGRGESGRPLAQCHCGRAQIRAGLACKDTAALWQVCGHGCCFWSGCAGTVHCWQAARGLRWGGHSGGLARLCCMLPVCCMLHLHLAPALGWHKAGRVAAFSGCSRSAGCCM